MIEYCNEQIEAPNVDTSILDLWIAHVVAGYNYELGELCYVFCDDDYILDVNIEYLQHNYYTDIITFDYTEGDIISGDMFISLDTIASNAKKFNQDFMDELHRVIIHGVLHLCGINDKTEEEASEMRSAENSALNILKRLQDEVKI